GISPRVETVHEPVFEPGHLLSREMQIQGFVVEADELPQGADGAVVHQRAIRGHEEQRWHFERRYCSGADAASAVISVACAVQVVLVRRDRVIREGGARMTGE